MLKKLFHFIFGKRSDTQPILIIKKETDDERVKEYKSIEEAIRDLENDPNIPADKLKKLKSSFINLNNRNSIRIKDGELLIQNKKDHHEKNT